MLKVSVIIPTYNCAQYIIEAIESVLNQTYKDFEIIVVDDGSTDNTKDVLKPYIESSLISYIYQENQGPGAARNKGIMGARGEYIAFLDADDTLLEESLFERQSFLSKYPEVYLVFTDCHVAYDSYIEYSPRLRKNKSLNLLKDIICLEENNEIIFNHKFYSECFKCSPLPILPSTVMLRKKIFDHIDLFRTDISIAEDMDLWLRVAEKYKIGFINESLCIYNKHRSSLTKNQEKYYIGWIKFLLSILYKIGIDKSLIRKRISTSYYSLGYYHFETHANIKVAKKYFLMSIRYGPLQLKSIKYFGLSLLPTKLIQVLRKFKQQHFRG